MSQSSSSSSSAEQKETSMKDQADQNNDNNIENLLRQLHGQIKSSGWLDMNTADKFEKENPELVKAWKDAINNDK